MKCAAIRAYRGPLAVHRRCAVLAVSPSAYYAWRQRRVSARAQADWQLAPIYRDHGLTYVALRHLEAIGLISFSHPTEMYRLEIQGEVRLSHFGRAIVITMQAAHDRLAIGHVILTQVGDELIFPRKSGHRVKPKTHCFRRGGVQHGTEEATTIQPSV